MARSKSWEEQSAEEPEEDEDCPLCKDDTEIELLMFGTLNHLH